MRLRHSADQSHPPQAATSGSGHVGRGGGLVNKHQLGRVHQALFPNPAPAFTSNVRSISLGRDHALLFKGDFVALEKPPDRRPAARDLPLVHRRDDLVQRQIRMLRHQFEHLMRMSFQRRRAAAARFRCDAPRSRQSAEPISPQN